MKHFSDALRSGWRLVAATTLIGVMAASIALMAATPLYTATASTFVSVNGAEESGSLTSATNYPTALWGEDWLDFYVSIVTSGQVMAGVVKDLGLPMSPTQLAEKIDVQIPDDTLTMEISATDPNPSLAQSIANATVDRFASEVESLQASVGGEVPPGSVLVTQPAPLPTSLSSPRRSIYLALGILGGMAVGVLAVLAQSRRRFAEDAIVSG